MTMEHKDSCVTNVTCGGQGLEFAECDCGANEPDHYKYSPSSASRWLACPGSAGADGKESDASRLGTLAHAVAEAFLSGEPMSQAHNEHFESLPDEDQEEMLEGVDLFVNYCKGLNCSAVNIEQKLKHPFIPDHGGTLDFAGWEPKESCIHVVDLKYGTYAVEAKNNPQLKCYLNLARRCFNWHAKKFCGTIIQPRLNEEPDTVYFTEEELDEFEIEVMFATESDEFAAGEQCTWCPLLRDRGDGKPCSVALEHGAQLAQLDFDVIEDDASALEQIILFRAAFNTLVDRCKEILIDRAREGQDCENVKVVYQMSNWIWQNEEGLRQKVSDILSELEEYPEVEGSFIDSVILRPAAEQRLDSMSAISSRLKKICKTYCGSNKPPRFDLKQFATKVVKSYSVVSRSTKGEEVDFAEGFVEIEPGSVAYEA